MWWKFNNKEPTFQNVSFWVFNYVCEREQSASAESPAELNKVLCYRQILNTLSEVSRSPRKPLLLRYSHSFCFHEHIFRPYTHILLYRDGNYLYIWACFSLYSHLIKPLQNVYIVHPCEECRYVCNISRIYICSWAHISLFSNSQWEVALSLSQCFSPFFT